jgi:chromosome segregation ATPase
MRNQLNQHIETRRKIEQQLPRQLAKIDEKEQELMTAEANKRKIDDDQEILNNRLKNVRGNLQNLHGQKNNQMAVFGAGIDQVLKEIQKVRWSGGPPIGPLGRYVTLKDPKYAGVLLSVLGNTMCSFAVRNAADRAQLQQILSRCQKLYVPRWYSLTSGAMYQAPVSVVCLL